MPSHNGQRSSGEILDRIDMCGDYDCGVACVAMLTGLAPDEIERRLGYSPAETRLPEICLGLLTEEVLLLLHQCGEHPLHVRTREDIAAEINEYLPDSPHAHVGATLHRRRLLPDHDDVLSMIAGRRAMLSVKPGSVDYGHFVVWDGNAVLDPGPGRLVEREGLGAWRIQAAIILLDAELPSASALDGTAAVPTTI